MEYGNVPQNRERIYIVGFKEKNILITLNFRKNNIKNRIQDMLEDIVNIKYYYNGKPLYDKLKITSKKPEKSINGADNMFEKIKRSLSHSYS